MADQERSTLAQAGPTVKSCWMCGIHLSADHMMADGGSACADVRWYCVDTRGCTERWTSRSPRSLDVQGAGGPAQAAARQPSGPGAIRAPV
jgi:hypothetical protein